MKLEALSYRWVVMMAIALPIVGAQWVLWWLIIVTLAIEIGTRPEALP